MCDGLACSVRYTRSCLRLNVGLAALMMKLQNEGDVCVEAMQMKLLVPAALFEVDEWPTFSRSGTGN